MTYGHITRVLTVRERKMEVSLEVVRHQPTVGVSRRNSWRDGTIIIEILGDGERFRRLQYRVVASRTAQGFLPPTTGQLVAAFSWPKKTLKKELEAAKLNAAKLRNEDKLEKLQQGRGRYWALWQA